MTLLRTRVGPWMLVAALASACATQYSLTPTLNEAVGQPLSTQSFPFRGPRSLVSDDGTHRTLLFSIDGMMRCKWELTIDKPSNVILGWRYPDKDSAQWCSQLPSTRP